MKATTFLITVFFVTTSLFCTQSFAQSTGKAADAQKQANLEKNKARQAELRKKYNSLSPEEAAIAKKRATDYKKSGGKVPPGSQTKNAAPAANPASKSGKPVTNPTQPAGTKKTLQGIPVTDPNAKQPAPVKKNTTTKPLNNTTTTAKPAAEKAPATKTSVPAEKK
jgi:hypothetical protein